MTLIFLLLTNISIYASNDSLSVLNQIKKGSTAILIRHTTTYPGYGDPVNFDLKDCQTQRNLSPKGKKEALKIKDIFVKHKIPTAKVYSSPWCRTIDTAKLSFGKYEVLDILGSPLGKGWKRSFIKDLENHIKKNMTMGNLVYVTHHFVIENLLNIVPQQGEMIIVKVVDDRLKIVGRIAPKDWNLILE